MVTASDDSGDLVAGLKKARVPTLVLPSAADLDESYDQIERVGAATGHAGRGRRGGHRDADRHRGGAGRRTRRGRASPTSTSSRPDLYTAAGATFIGEIYGLFGLENVADEAGKGDEYPQLSSEYVVSADPDLVFLADGECCEVAAADVDGPAGLGSRSTAVEDGQVHVVNEDIASRWGPRVVDFVKLISEILTEREQALGDRTG